MSDCHAKSDPDTEERDNGDISVLHPWDTSFPSDLQMEAKPATSAWATEVKRAEWSPRQTSSNQLIRPATSSEVPTYSWTPQNEDYWDYACWCRQKPQKCLVHRQMFFMIKNANQWGSPVALLTPSCIDTVTKESKEQQEQCRENAVGKKDWWRRWEKGKVLREIQTIGYVRHGHFQPVITSEVLRSNDEKVNQYFFLSLNQVIIRF